ncbi:hypothetical protein K2X14_14665 [Acetobacter sp. TBRC 12305]|uniref:HTH DNA binding domain-containing protein n=1 Tax=Acetobacter garciniae TaxID=2817435 RepID=A0A939KR06_9PROT|nr:hypothetical protein [Acetobacter garciniae]MBX0346079.1 hypothetical protein [Acetobacter garciniae]
MAAVLTRTATLCGQLDQWLHRHPLREVILFRARLEAARNCAAVDGFLVDPWYLAAVLEGLRPRIRGQDVFERGNEVDAAHATFEQYQWLARPTGLQREAIAQAMDAIKPFTQVVGPLLGGALAFRQWIEAGHGRAPLRGALVRLWCEEGLLRTALPLTGAAAFRSGTSWTARTWVPCWLRAIGDEAEVIRDMTRTLEASWHQARLQAGDQRRNSRASAAIDVIAAHPVISATSLAARLSMSIKAACLLLERFLERGLIVEVTHRSARRLFALRDMAPLREAVQPRPKAMPGRKRGRPRASDVADVQDFEDSRVEQNFQPLERWTPDYSELEAAMAEVDLLCRRSQA